MVFLKNTFPNDLTLEGLRIVLDCANGAAYRVAPTVLEELGAEVIAIGVEPNGENINDGCGSLHPEVVSRLVLEKGADIGIALDGDGDRIVFVDRQGRKWTETISWPSAVCRCLSEGRLKKKTLVTTVMSNMGLERAMKKAGGKWSGHRWEIGMWSRKWSEGNITWEENNQAIPSSWITIRPVTAS